jgi:hypothetical protein
MTEEVQAFVIITIFDLPIDSLTYPEVLNRESAFR